MCIITTRPYLQSEMSQAVIIKQEPTKNEAPGIANALTFQIQLHNLYTSFH